MDRILIKSFVMIIAGILWLSGPHDSAASAYKITDIAFPGARTTILHDINDAGTVVGDFVDTGGTSHGFLYDGDTFTRLDDHPASINGSYFYGINNAGTTVGFIFLIDGVEGFKYDGTNFTPVNFPGATFTHPYGINDSNIIVGEASSSEFHHTFIHDGTSFTTLDFPSDPSGWAINNSGHIVGEYEDPLSPGKDIGYLYDGINTSAIDFPGSLTTSAKGISNIGEIVGYYRDDVGFHGFQYNGVNFTSFDISGARQIVPTGINNDGMIVGYYWDADERMRSFLAKPIPEPSTLLILGSGLVGLAILGRKRFKK